MRLLLPALMLLIGLYLGFCWGCAVSPTTAELVAYAKDFEVRMIGEGFMPTAWEDGTGHLIPQKMAHAIIGDYALWRKVRRGRSPLLTPW